MNDHAGVAGAGRDQARAFARSFAAAAVPAFLLIGLIDLAFAAAIPGPAIDGLAGKAHFALQVMGLAAATGLLWMTFSLVLKGVDRLGKGLSILGARFSPGIILLILLATIGLEWVNLATFDGPGFRQKSYAGLVRWGFRLGAPIAVFVFAFIVLRLQAGLAKMRSAAFREVAGMLLSGFALIVSLSLVFANAAIHRGTYSHIHQQEIAGAIVAMFFVVLWAPDWLAAQVFRRKRAFLLVIVAVLLALGALFGRQLDIHRVVGGAVNQRALATEQYGFVAESLFDRILPAKTRGPIDPSLAFKRGEVVSSEELARRLDGILPDRRKFNLFWIALDTVRADHCGFNGYARNTTPSLDKLAAESINFRNARAPYPTSNFSYSSMLTSLPPRITPAYKHYRKKDYEYHALTSLPALLAQAGWHTIGVSAFDKDMAEDDTLFGSLRDGFAVYNPDQKPSRTWAPAVNASVLSAIKRAPRHPWFAFCHYLEPHAPYQKRDKFDFGDTTIDLYDAGIAYCDARVQEIIDDLKATGAWDRTVIVVFSDHGEEFREHGSTFHNSNVYEPQIHVPLLIRIPGLKGAVVDVPVNLMDVLPTMTDLLGVADGQDRFGRSLLPRILGIDTDELGFSYSEWFGFRAGKHVNDQRCVIVGGKKLLYRPYKDQVELYDVGKDKLERNSLIGKEQEWEDRLTATARAFDERIENYKFAAGGAGAGAAKAEVAEFVRGRVERLASGPANEHATIANEVVNKLFDYYFNPTVQAADELGDEGIAKVLHDSLANYAKLHPRARYALLRAVTHWQSHRFREFFQRAVTEEPLNQYKFYCAVGLAMGGDESARGPLRDLIANPGFANKPEVAIGLLHLGDPAAAEWAVANLFHPERTTVVWTVREFHRIDFGQPRARILRDRFAFQPFRAFEESQALMDAIGADRDEDALLLLLRMAQDREEEVRDRAAAILGEAMPAGPFDQNMAAMVLEIEGDLAVKNRAYDLAWTRMTEALAKGTLHNASLRFRLARAMYLLGRQDRVKEVLEVIREKAPLERDRKLAERRLMQVDSPLKVVPKSFAAAVDGSRLELPPLTPNTIFAIRLPIRNAGSGAWHGGNGIMPISLEIGFESADGKAVEIAKTPENLLVEEGLNPGEEQVLVLRGMAPADLQGTRLVIRFRQTGVVLPDDGLIYRHAETITR